MTVVPTTRSLITSLLQGKERIIRSLFTNTNVANLPSLSDGSPKGIHYIHKMLVWKRDLRALSARGSAKMEQVTKTVKRMNNLTEILIMVVAVVLWLHQSLSWPGHRSKGQ